MKSDLLDAQSCVDWTIAHIPLFEQRLQLWLKGNIDVVVRDIPSDPLYNALILREKEPLPLAFNVEAGAYINTLRSSLDILAWTIYRREPEPVLFPDQVYFPVANCRRDFANGNYRGNKFVEQLSGTARKLIESVKPYNGGNNALYGLHQFDILRKHRRLLTTEASPTSLVMWGVKVRGTVHPIPHGFLPDIDGETVLGRVSKGEQKPKLQFSPYVTLNEPKIMARCPLASALMWFAAEANRIISLFDY